MLPRSARLCLLAPLLVALASLAAAPLAHAEGSPSIALSVQAAKSVLYGAPSPVTLAASNPSGQPYGYNLSYRAVLPEGISYRSGSSAIAPQVISNEPAAGRTTLIWSNVQDLSPNSHGSIGFEVEHSTSTFGVGGRYKIEAGAYIASEPRYLPKFSATGAPEGPASTSFTGYATGSAETIISALEVTQAEPSPKGEILRGVHDHQVQYTATVRNTTVNSTAGAVAEEWLPAGLEYLGCGGAGMDHTTEAPTNPGSAEEYPGAGRIEAGAVSGCQAPTIVETVRTDPDGAGPDPEAVYTRVVWNLATLAPGATRTLKFLAAVPLRENTLTWTKGAPSSSGEAQAANLDNNSGAETRDGQSLTSYAFAAGDYAGTLPVNADSYLTRVAKDLIIEKGGDTEALNAGQIVRWTLTLRSSEYRYNTGIEVTDTVPDGLCPLAATNLAGSSQPSDSECAPTGKPEDLPSSEYLSAVENENGTWTLKWNDAADAALANLKANEVTTIGFSTRTRVDYQENHKDGKPILADDHITNSAGASATTNVVCESHSDCEAGGATPIDHERPLSEEISDSASATLKAQGPQISKEIAATSSATCEGVAYTKATPVYEPGDLICWKLDVVFPTSLYTQGDQVTDYPPLDAIFDTSFNGGAGQRAGSKDTLSETTFNDSEAGGTAGGVVRWTLPDSGSVKEGGQVFERIVQSTATLPVGATPGELQGNLMKFANLNTESESFSLRAEADFQLQFPQLTLTKRITEVAGKAIAPAGEASIDGGQSARFAITVTNSGEAAASGARVMDVLPEGLGCTAGSVSAISAGGVCDPTSNRITWEGIGVGAKSAVTLTFEAKMPVGVGPDTSYRDQAGVEQYESATNVGTSYVYEPEDNIEPLTETAPNAIPADASATLNVPDATVAKTHTTAIVGSGDSAAQATIGEVARYEVSATIPSGTTLGGHPKITDPGLPSKRLILVAGSVEASVNGAAAAGVEAHEEAGSPYVELPEGYSAPAGGSPTVVEMRFEAYVADVAENARGGSIPNTGRLSWEDPTLGPQTRTSPIDSLPIVEPSISIKDANNGGSAVHGGQHVEYSIEARNASGASPAYGNRVVETVPSGVTPIDSEGKPLANGAKTADGGVWEEAARTITWELASLESGEAHTFHYDVEVDEKPVSGASLTDHAIATTTSLPGATEVERERRRTSGTGYAAEVSTTLTPGGPTVAKSSDSEKATIGHRVTYTLTVTLPAQVTSFDDTVIDTLPDSLDFDEYVSGECVSGCPPGVTIQSYAPKVNANGTTSVGWYLGDLESTSAPRTLKLVYRADVRATHRQGGAEVKAGEEIKNSAGVHYDKSKKLAFEAGAIPSAGFFEEKSSTVSTTTKVTEPKIAILKEASVDKGPFSASAPTLSDGDSIAYRLKVSNEGTSAAYDVPVVDTLPSSLTEALAGSTDLEQAWTSGEPTMKWRIPAIAAGETVQLTYEAKLVSAAQLRAGETVPNAAKVPAYFGAPEAERAEGLEEFEKAPIAYREYAGPEASVTGTVAMPALSIVKTTGGSGFPPTANAEVGQPFPWRVVVKNTGTAAARSLAIDDVLPPNWEYVTGSASFSTGSSYAPVTSGALEPGFHLTWSTGIELAPGAEAVLTYRARPTLAAETTPGTGTPNLNSASASVTDAAGSAGDEEGPFASGPATATADLVVPDLRVSKEATRSRVNAGEADSYTITVENAGQGVARDVKVLDTMPSGVSYAAGSASATPTTGFSEVAAGAGSVEWDLAEIPAGASVAIDVPVRTAADLSASTVLTNFVAASSAEETTPVQATATIETTESADLVAEKTVVGRNEAIPGEHLTYEVSARNEGPSRARDVKLVDVLPAGLTYVTGGSGCTQSAGTVTCEAGEVEAGSKASAQITVAVSPSAKGPISNTVHVESSTPDPQPANNEATVVSPTTPTADLKLVKTALTPKVLDGQQAGFQLVASDEGPGDAPEAVILDTLPAGMSFVRAEGATCAAAGQEVTCQLGTLTPGQEAAVKLVTQVTGAGLDTNRAVASSAASDPEPANDESRASVEVLPAADLSLQKTATPSEDVQLPGEVTYALKATNHGPDEAREALVTDELPAGETLLEAGTGCSASGQRVTCSIGDLASGESSTVDLKVRVGLSLGESTVTNTAEVSSATGDPEPADNTASAQITTGPVADVSISKQGPASAVTGEQIAWKLTVEDHGPSSAHHVTVTDPLPAGVTFTGASPSQGTCAIAAQTLTCELGTLADGARAEVTVSATLTAPPGLIQNTATVSAEEPDPALANNASTAGTQVGAAPSPVSLHPPATPPARPPANPSPHDKAGSTERAPRLKLKVSLPDRSVAPGEHLVYRLTIANAGKGTASDPVVCDRLPSQATVVSLGGGRISKGRVCYRIPRLRPGKRHVFKLVLRANSNAHGTILNPATVSAKGVRPVRAKARRAVHGAQASHTEDAVTG